MLQYMLTNKGKGIITLWIKCSWK